MSSLSSLAESIQEGLEIMKRENKELKREIDEVRKQVDSLYPSNDIVKARSMLFAAEELLMELVCKGTDTEDRYCKICDIIEDVKNECAHPQIAENWEKYHIAWDDRILSRLIRDLGPPCYRELGEAEDFARMSAEEIESTLRSVKLRTVSGREVRAVLTLHKHIASSDVATLSMGL